MGEHGIPGLDDRYSQLYENKTLTTIGLLLVIFGLIIGISSLVNSIPLLLISNRIYDLESFKSIFQELDENTAIGIHTHAKTILVYFVNLNLIKVIISTIGIFGGIGLLRQKVFGIKASRMWAWLAIIYLLSDSVIYLGILIPAAMSIVKIIPIKFSGDIQEWFKSFIDIAKSILYTVIIITNLIMVVLPFATIRTFNKFESV